MSFRAVDVSNFFWFQTMLSFDLDLFHVVHELLVVEVRVPLPKSGGSPFSEPAGEIKVNFWELRNNFVRLE